MLEINAYHDNIVNLQGMTYTKSPHDNSLVEVHLKNIYTLPVIFSIDKNIRGIANDNRKS